MTHTSMSSGISRFRCRLIAYVVLAAFVTTFLPPVVLAQQPTATLSTVTGTVLVNGQSADQGAVLQAGDVVETQDGARVVLELSDGSQLELSENTRLDLAQLSQTSDGARVSKVKLAWGWIRAKLSPGHQDEGSTFDVETPNALVGVKFSQPQFDVGYIPPAGDDQAAETRAVARTVALTATNLLTNETVIVPVGSSVVISAIGIQIIASLLEAGTVATQTGFGTKAAIGAGVVLAAGGAVALTQGGDDGGSSGVFSGTWLYQDEYEQWTLFLNQSGNSLSGEYQRTLDYSSDYPEKKWGDIGGEVSNNIAYITFLNGMAQWGDEEPFSYNPDPITCERRDNGHGVYLYCDGWMAFYRQ